MNFTAINYNIAKYEPQEFFDLYLNKVQGELKYMKLENLKIGNTYYLPAKYCPTNYTYGTLIKIVDNKHVLLQRRKDIIRCHIDKLHISADKAVRGVKHKREQEEK